MAFDHYVSQVHFKPFRLKKKLFTISKQTLRYDLCSPRSICRFPEGNTNNYLEDPRAIERFLVPIENNYGSAIESILNRKIDNKVIFTIAGWIASVYSCSPTGIRLFQPILKNIAHETTRVLEIIGLLPSLELPNNQTFTELLDKRKVEIEIDPKYCQSIGVEIIQSLAYVLGNLKWEFLLNPFSSSPFFTSDNPIAIEPQRKSPLCNILVPLTPMLALRIHTIYEENHFSDKEFSRNSIKFKQLKFAEVQKINMYLVQSAENHIYFGKLLPWMEAFIRKHSKHRIEIQTTKLRRPKGCTVFTQKVLKKRETT